jgi:tRNA modification GTPase
MPTITSGMTNNRVILLTPPGPAAIAVIRLVGDQADEFLRRHFSRPVAAGKAIHGSLTDGDRVIDDPLVVMISSRLFDISVHGGPWVVRSVLELAQKAGFEVVGSQPIPLPDDAIDGEDELDRQMLAHLPLAKTELALRCLLSQPAAGRRLMARNPTPRPSSSDPSLWWLLHPPNVAIVGAPNVGKSTLANQLFAQERSITADVPGTTRDWVGEMADLDGLAIFLMDTPGLRDTDDPIETAAIEQSRPQVQRADLIVLVVDAMHPLEHQRSWAKKYPQALVVRNKIDRSAEITPIDASRPHIYTTATNGQGVDSLRQAIRRQFVRSWRHLTRPRDWHL